MLVVPRRSRFGYRFISYSRLFRRTIDNWSSFFGEEGADTTGYYILVMFGGMVWRSVLLFVLVVDG